jgi:PTH1 family peptidyl-tRNA hydrolase
MPEPRPPLRLVLGLGNPGPQYEHTRHNAGFWLVDELARRYVGHFRLDARFSSAVCQIDVAGQLLWLLKPLTFMNRSGQAVRRFVNFYKIPLSAILVVHDDLDLPPGMVRLKRSGGHGGHNGLRDIIQHLGSNDFLRLRLGIGHPASNQEVIDYVLHRAPLQEQLLIEHALNAAVSEFPRLVEGQLEKVMHLLHSRPTVSQLTT